MSVRKATASPVPFKGQKTTETAERRPSRADPLKTDRDIEKLLNGLDLTAKEKAALMKTIRALPPVGELDSSPVHFELIDRGPSKFDEKAGRTDSTGEKGMSVAVAWGAVHAAAGLFGETETLPGMGARPDFVKLAAHLASEFSGPGAADKLGARLSPPGADATLVESTLVYVAPALLAFGRAFAASKGEPFATTTKTVVNHTPEQWRSRGDADALVEKTGRELGLGALRDEQAAQGRELSKALRLPDGDPRKAKAIETFYAESAKTDAAVAPILSAAEHAGYGELAEQGNAPYTARFEGHSADFDRLMVGSERTETRQERDGFKEAFNQLLGLRSADPKGFDAAVKKLTVDPTAFLAVLCADHVAPYLKGSVATVVEAVKRELVPGAPEAKVLSGFGKLYAALLHDPEHAGSLSALQKATFARDRETPLLRLLGAKAGVDADTLARVAGLSLSPLDFDFRAAASDHDPVVARYTP